MGGGGEGAGKARRALPETQLSKENDPATPKSLAFGEKLVANSDLPVPIPAVCSNDVATVIT